jgi:hypothetical protein
MPFDEFNSNDGDPIEGKGKEILPDRGMPFEEVTDELTEELALGAPRDVTPEELTSLFDEVSAGNLKGLGKDWLEVDSGMGAAEPIMTEGDFVSQDLPDDEPTAAEPVPKPYRGLPKAKFTDPDLSVGWSEVEKRPGSARLESEEEMTELFITRDRMEALWTRIDQAQKEIRAKVPSISLARELIEQLERARNEILAGMENFEEAERTINEVEVRISILDRAKQDNWAAIALFLYEVLWAIGLVIFFVTITGQELTDNILLVQSAAWGSLGGITGAFYALWKHVSREMDFSKQYSLWYISNPIMGLVLGALVFLVTNFTLISLFSGTGEKAITSPFVIYLLAFVIGYQQNVAWALIRRVVKVLQLGENAEEKR